MKNTIGASVAGMTACLLTVSAHAQGNYRSTPQGGRSALMGGTGVALGNDGATPFLNPAGIVRIENGTVAFSASFLNASWSSQERLFQPRAPEEVSLVGDAELANTSFSRFRIDSVPSTFCVFAKLKVIIKDPTFKGSNLALCLGSSERSDVAAMALPFQASSGPYRVTSSNSFHRSFRRTLVGPTYGLPLGKWALGISLHGVESGLHQSATSEAVVSENGRAVGSSFTSELDAHSVDVVARLGVSYKPDRWTTYGLSVQMPAFHITGSALATENQSSSRGYQRLTVGKGTMHAPPPPSISAGVGYEWGKWRIETNLFLFFPQPSGYSTKLDLVRHSAENGVERTETESTEVRQHAQTVVDAAIGVEYFLRPHLSMLTGFSTDFSAAPPLSRNPPLGTALWNRGSRVAASFGLGSYGDSGALLMGLEFSYTQGKANGANSLADPGALALIDHRSVSALFVLAGQTSFSQVKSTVDRLRNITGTK